MGKFVDFIAWSDAPHLNPPHLSQEEIDAAYEALPPHMREARSKGIPSIGSGAVYPVSDANIVCEPFPIPAWWGQACGLDVGWRVTAAVLGAIDPEHDVMYITQEYYSKETGPAYHAAALLAMMPYPLQVAIDPASETASQVDGRRLAREYKALGLDIRPADNAVEAGIHKVLTRMQTGRLKVFANCTEWMKEKRMYRRKGEMATGTAAQSDAAMGKIVKQNDHLMDATRYMVYTPGVFRQARAAKENAEGGFRKTGGEF